jgi:ubiquinone/menaquinone biosynthesis C-methylase UbiE
VSTEQSVAAHYTLGRLGDAIEAALGRLGLDPDRLTTADLAPIDEFHIGGREATARFVERLGLAAGQRVLDVGSGIGGPARYVAERFGCRVTGIDLTAEFCRVAAALTARVGLADRVDLHHGSALAMPFADGTFDAAYTIHMAMNIADKAALYREIHRVLRPGGAFGIYDVLAGPRGGVPYFPVPWARAPATSFLVSAEELRTLLQEAGFSVESTAERTGYAIDFFRARLAKAAQEGAPPLGLHVLMGEDFPLMVRNVLASLEAGRIAAGEVVCRRP